MDRTTHLLKMKAAVFAIVVITLSWAALIVPGVEAKLSSLLRLDDGDDGKQRPLHVGHHEFGASHDPTAEYIRALIDESEFIMGLFGSMSASLSMSMPASTAPVPVPPPPPSQDTPAPVTPAPATVAPATPAPGTLTPVTEPPVTLAPATQPPVTPAPATASPITPAPATTAPGTPAPQTPAPVTSSPLTPAPANPASVSPAPVTPAPVTIAPAPAPPSTDSPTPVLDKCHTAYAYCDGQSACFIGTILEPGSGKGPWGWTIDLENVDFSNGGVLECDLIAGAGQCDLDEGVLVGKALISQDSVEYNLFPTYGGRGYHLYGGECFANDAGEHLLDGNCDPNDIEMWVRVPGKYSLITGPQFNPLLPTFSFNILNQEGEYRHGIWKNQGYELFPLGDPVERRYVSIHMTVCSCSVEAGGCADVPVPTTVDPNVLQADKGDSVDDEPPLAARTSAQSAATPTLLTTILVGAVAVVSMAVVAWRRRMSSAQSVYSELVDERSAVPNGAFPSA